MTIDPHYSRNILEAFEAAPTSTTDIRALEKAGFSLDEKFIFHMEDLAERGLIERADKTDGIGLDRGAGDSQQWSVIPLRLTASGRAYLNEP
jgi:hypothetical protein